MNTLIGMAVGVLASVVLIGLCAAISAMVFYNTDPLSLYSGIAIGAILIVAIVAWLA